MHAKLYLLFRNDKINPIISFLGSSNLTLAGLSKQGELNVDILDLPADEFLAKWFEDRWNDRGCVDISDELVKIIEESWAREELIPPYQIYIKMAYHLSQEARDGLTEFKIPRVFGNRLLPFQAAAVKIAAHHLNKRDGVLIGDVVGLGKTIMACAVARIFEEDQSFDTLIICPRNLVNMWKSYKSTYELRADVLSISQVINKLPNLKRYKMVVIDESHNLRNREGRRYKIIREYIEQNDSKVILLSATPYNKTYLDLSNQLRLFLPEDKLLPIRPEKLINELSETGLIAKYQCSPRSLAAFEKSIHPDDWREMMRLYMVRRTRSFIMANYAETDETNHRKYLLLEDNTRSYFPTRIPRTIKFKIDEQDPYARLYAEEVVDAVNTLNLPRYGLGTYVDESITPATNADGIMLKNLSQAGKRLMGFCRTNLYKRLESSGQVFLQSVDRHILRNYVYLHALENNLPLPIGTQDISLLDSRSNDEDIDSLNFFDIPAEDEHPEEMYDEEMDVIESSARNDFRARAAELYHQYQTTYKNRFKWIDSCYFLPDLKEHLAEDAAMLLSVLKKAGEWDWEKDNKLKELIKLVSTIYPKEKVLIFTQYADTVRYLEDCLQKSGITAMAGVAGSNDNPTDYAMRFSPTSNDNPNLPASRQLRVLVATDVLSEGQNLQDGYIVINYDLPWAIVRLIQRAGRVDRIGQKSEEILCYSFLPAEGVEKIIKLRAKVRQRLKENAEVVGTDEAFFSDDQNDQAVADLYNEKAGILDGEEDADVDLASYAYQIWKNAITDDPSLKKVIEDMPPVVFSAKQVSSKQQPGALVYARVGDEIDALAWIDKNGQQVTESQYEILRAAECLKEEPALPRPENHHQLVTSGVKAMIENERTTGGSLGSPRGARFKTYERMRQFIDKNKDTLFVTPELKAATDEIYKFPLRELAKDILNRQMKAGIEDQELVELVVNLREEGRLCVVEEDFQQAPEPTIICSLGLVN